MRAIAGHDAWRLTLVPTGEGPVQKQDASHGPEKCVPFFGQDHAPTQGEG